MRIALVNRSAHEIDALRALVESGGSHEVAWTTHNGADAVARAARDRPDLILLDLRLDELDGVEATRRIMAATPTAILIVTDAIGSQAGRVFDALRHGAVDAVDGSLVPGERGAARLLEKIEMVERLRDTSPPTARATAPSSASATSNASVPQLIAIGSSTGGPGALVAILADLPKTIDAAIMVVQHIDPSFVVGLVDWLRARTELEVVAISAGDRLVPGRVHVAATSDHVVLDRSRRLRYVEEPRELPFRPSVDVFFRSLVSAWPRPGTAVLLTGMGSDGAEGLLELRHAGWHTIAQDQASCVIYGMPRAAVELGAACETIALGDIAAVLRRRTGAGNGRKAARMATG